MYDYDEIADNWISTYGGWTAAIEIVTRTRESFRDSPPGTYGSNRFDHWSRVRKSIMKRKPK